MIHIAFGITKVELNEWKRTVELGEIAYITHYWSDERFPNCKTVTKVGCSDLAKLESWCLQNKLDPRYIHKRDKFPHFDLLGPYQLKVLKKEGQFEQIKRFKLDSIHYTDRW